MTTIPTDDTKSPADMVARPVSDYSDTGLPAWQEIGLLLELNGAALSRPALDELAGMLIWARFGKKAADLIEKQAAELAGVTYSSKQSTGCAGCGEVKHTPLRVDALGGYVCLACIDRALPALLARAKSDADLIEKQAAELAASEIENSKLSDLAYYEVGGAPHNWEDRALAAERKLQSLGIEDWYCGFVSPGSQKSHPSYMSLLARAEAAEAALSTATAPDAGDQPTHRHKKRGSEYVLIGIGKMQAKNWAEPIRSKISEHVFQSRYIMVDMREVAIYRCVDDGSLWAQPREEFEAARFEVLPVATGTAPDADARVKVTDEMVERVGAALYARFLDRKAARNILYDKDGVPEFKTLVVSMRNDFLLDARAALAALGEH